MTGSSLEGWRCGIHTVEWRCVCGVEVWDPHVGVEVCGGIGAIRPLPCECSGC